MRAPRRLLLAVSAVLVLGAVSIDAALGRSFYVKPGTYKTKAKVPANNDGLSPLPATSFTASFKAAPIKPTGTRELTGITVGPVKGDCFSPPQTGVPEQQGQFAYPKIKLPKFKIYGGINAAWVLRSGHWKLASGYQGPLPEVVLSLVYNAQHQRFDPNPSTYPSVAVNWSAGSDGKPSNAGAYKCSAAAVAIFKHA